MGKVGLLWYSPSLVAQDARFARGSAQMAFSPCGVTNPFENQRSDYKDRIGQ
jgi:hypothetical protein